MKRKLTSIFNKLLKAFGRQGWWPAKSSFEVMVGAILTQSTSWRNVEKAIVALKKEKVLSVGKLFKMPQRRLALLIKPAGYYNIKAKRLKNFLEFFLKHYQGQASRMSKENTSLLRRQLLSVNGIGEETADSILLYALNKPAFVVDAYTKRVFQRHKMIKSGDDYQKIRDLFIRNLKPDARMFNEYHALLVKLAKEHCLKTNPKCAGCPLND